MTNIGELRKTLAGTATDARCEEIPILVTRLRSMRRLPVTANIVPSELILVTLMMKALRSSETSVLNGVTWRNIPEDGILLSRCREKLNSYITKRSLLYIAVSTPCLEFTFA
jgi:hypothetical protein